MLDVVAARRDYFDKLWSRLGSDDLIFFDPDNGLEVPSRPRGRRDSSKYLYWDELARALDGGHSICVYQHFPRKPRAPFVAALLDRLGDLAPGNRAFAVLSPRVAYIVCALAPFGDRLLAAAATVAVHPASRLACTDTRTLAEVLAAV